MADSSNGFYRNVPSFTDFSSVTDLSFYRALPDDWSIVFTDITSSTTAIEEGRYKDVNMIGAACITAVLNALPDLSIPYVFGGDGATLAVPSVVTPQVSLALAGTQKIALHRFNLELRAGIVSLHDIRQSKNDVFVAKFELSPGNAMAMFTGGGIQFVESTIKHGEDAHLYTIKSNDNDEAPDLEGLSCRWEPLETCNGTMMSMLVHATGKNPQEDIAIYREIINGVEWILQSGMEQASPVNTANMVLNWPSDGLRREVKLAAGTKNFFRKVVWVYFTGFVQYFLEKFDLKAGGYDARIYRQELRVNSDFRRFDDTLRMILDCTLDVAGEIESFFADLRKQGKIAYGIHRSDQALMTCLVFGLDQGEHVHFIDGSDGGFATASLQLKAQIQESANSALT